MIDQPSKYQALSSNSRTAKKDKHKLRRSINTKEEFQKILKIILHKDEEVT
jgi:hypothetical protein